MAQYPPADGVIEYVTRAGGDEGEGLAGAGDAGIEQFPGQNRVGAVGQDQRGMCEFGALGFMDGQGVDRLHRLQATGQDPMDARAGRRGERDAQAFAAVARVGQPQRDADIAVHQPQAVVVADDQYGPALVPALGPGNQSSRVQPAGDGLIQTLDAPGTAAHRAEQLEPRMRLQDIARPVVVIRAVGARQGPVRGQSVQIVAIARGQRGFGLYRLADDQSL